MNCERVWDFGSIFLILLLRLSYCQTAARQLKADNFLLVACRNDSVIQQLDLFDPRKQTAFNMEIGGNKHPLTVAYDPADANGGHIYWTDELTRAVYKYKPAENSHKVFYQQQNNDSHYGGIAIDTVNRKLYVTDAGNGLVIELELDGATDAVTVNHRIVDWEHASRPRSIAVDPLNKMLYWVDSTSECAAIYRKPVSCGKKIPIVTSTGLQTPYDLTALAIDLENQILYWVNSVHVGKVALDGTGFNSSILGPFELLHYLALAVNSSHLFLTHGVGFDKSTLHVKRRQGDRSQSAEESSNCGGPVGLFLYSSSDASRTYRRARAQDSVCTPAAASCSPALPTDTSARQNTHESASSEPTTLPFEASTAAAMDHVDNFFSLFMPVTTLVLGVALGAVAATLLVGVIGTIVCCARRKRNSSSATLSPISMDNHTLRRPSAAQNVVRYSTMAPPAAKPAPPPLPPIRPTNGGVATGSADEYEQPSIAGVSDTAAKSPQPKSPGRVSVQYMPLDEYFDVAGSGHQQRSTDYDTLTQKRVKQPRSNTLPEGHPEGYFDVAPRQRELVETYDYGAVNESAAAAIPPSRDQYLSVINDDEFGWRT